MSSAFFVLVIFEIGFCVFLPRRAWAVILLLILPASYRTQLLVVEMGMANFLQELAWNCHLPGLYLLSR
jgi:hypothetical protein